MIEAPQTIPTFASLLAPQSASHSVLYLVLALLILGSWVAVVSREFDFGLQIVRVWRKCCVAEILVSLKGALVACREFCELGFVMASAASSVLGLGSTGSIVGVQRASSISSEVTVPSGFTTRRRSARVSSSPHLRSEFLPSLAPVKKTPKLVTTRKAIPGVATQAIASDPTELRAAREDVKKILKEKHCHPILIRLGWHDAGTYDKNVAEWPLRGGANGSLRYSIELDHAANAGLFNAIALLDPVKEKYPNISYADLFQLASATAIEDAGGPQIPLRYGRRDVEGDFQCVKEGSLPDAAPPSPADHLRKVFYRMGLNDQDIVALSGTHSATSQCIH